MKKLSVLLICAALVGCGEGEVDKVKSTPIKGYSNYTYGKVLNNHKVCENAEWKNYEENGVKKVSYTCSLKKGKNYFNFDENVAARIRQEESNKYIALQKNKLPEQIEANKESQEQEMAYLARVKDLDNVTDYVKYMSELESSDIIFTIPAEGIIDAYSEVPEIRQYVATVLNYTPVSTGNLGFELLSAYKNKSASGFTADETAALQLITDMSRKYVVKKAAKEMLEIQEKIAVLKDSSEVLKERLENPDIILKEATHAGEVLVEQYAMTHSIKGEEVIIWAWNPVDEQYNVERQFLKNYTYGDRYGTLTFNIERPIYSATNNITNIDVYMEYYRITSPTELENLIYSKR